MKEDTKLLKDELPNIDVKQLETPDLNRLFPKETTLHPPRIVLLYGSIRERSYSRFVTEEAAKILNKLGAETRVFDPRGLPQRDGATEDHPKVEELRDLVLWAEGMVWTSPERHGAMTSILKAQIDWIPLSVEIGRTVCRGR